MNSVTTHTAEDGAMKDVRREKWIAIGILAFALIGGAVIILVTRALVVDSGVAMVFGVVFASIFVLLALHHYITGVWSPQRALRHKFGK